MRLPIILPFLSLIAFTLPQAPASQILHSGEDISLRGVSSSDSGKILWATGNKGTVLRSSDSGKTWANLHIDNSGTQDFRGVQSFGANIAYVFSVGNDNKSHVYKTTDAGATWHLKYSDPRPAFFLDGLVCRTEKNCFAISDPIDGKFPILHTEDGEHWAELPPDSEPAALPTEGLFAASNTSLILCGPTRNDIFFATGGPAARVFHSADNARTWTIAATPILSGNASYGIFSIACSGSTVVAVGGDYRNPANAKSVAAYSIDMGSTWQLSDKPPAGYRASVVAVPSKRVSTTWVAVGTTGADISTDTGAHWVRLNRKNSNAVIATGSDLVLVVGPQSTLYELKVLKDLW